MRRLTLFLGAAAVLAAGVALAASPLHVAGASGGAPSRVIAMGSVHDLAVEGSTVAYGMRSPDAYGVWSISGGLVKYISPQRHLDPEAVAEGTGLAVLRGGVVAWGTHGETNHSTLDISFARVAAPKVLKTLFSGTDDFLGSMAADGVTLAFSTQSGPYVGGIDARLYVGSTRRVTEVRHVTGWMDDVAVEGGLVAVGYRNGRVEVLRLTGNSVVAFPVGTAPRGIELDGGRLVALTERDVSLRSLSNGRIILVRPLQRPGRNVVLLDVQAGLVVYKAGRELRLLRLSDGRETRVPATAADPNTLYSRFGTPGLVVSHDRVVQVIPAATLAELLDAAG